MKDPNNREMMRDFYKLYEQYETMPDVSSMEETWAYFDQLNADGREFYKKYPGDMSLRLWDALAGARQEEWKDIKEKKIRKGAWTA